MYSYIRQNFRYGMLAICGTVLAVIIFGVPNYQHAKAEWGGTATHGAYKKAGGVSYYHLHCNDQDTSDTKGNVLKELPLVLLHGAKFTKEDWKSPSGILKDICQRKTKHRRLNVFAVDLLVVSDYKELISFLEHLKEWHKIGKPPVALVTPSASGKTMTTWAAALASGTDSSLTKYVERWIPIAATAFTRAPNTDIQALKDLPILAVYGSDDKAGKASSERLETFAGAKPYELQGGHSSCYLENDGPKLFVDALIHFIDVE